MNTKARSANQSRGPAVLFAPVLFAPVLFAPVLFAPVLSAFGGMSTP